MHRFLRGFGLNAATGTFMLGNMEHAEPLFRHRSAGFILCRQPAAQPRASPIPTSRVGPIIFMRSLQLFSVARTHA